MKNPVLIYLQAGHQDIASQAFSISQMEKAFAVVNEQNQAHQVALLAPHIHIRHLKKYFQIACSKGYRDIVETLFDHVSLTTHSRGLYIALSHAHEKMCYWLMFEKEIPIKLINGKNPLFGSTMDVVVTLNKCQKEHKRILHQQKIAQIRQDLDDSTPPTHIHAPARRI